MRSRRQLIGFACLMALMPVLAWPATSVVTRASLSMTNAWVGQRVVVHIDVLTAEGWAKVDRVPSIEIAGAHVVRMESQGIRLNEPVDGVTMTGQRYEYFLFPRRPGTLTLPALSLVATVQTYGAAGGSKQFPVSTESLSLSVTLPQGATSGADLVTTSDLTLTQTWAPEGDATRRVGESIVRTLSLSAADVVSMAFPPITHAQIAGVGIYPDQPHVRDRYDRGALSAERVDRVTYMLETPGEVTLPAFTLEWFDLDAGELRRTTVEGLSFTVEGVGSDGSAAAAAGRTAGLWRYLMVAVLVLVIAGGMAALVYRKRRRDLGRSDESDLFHELTRKCGVAEPLELYGALVRWVDGSEGAPSATPRLDRFVEEQGDDLFRGLVESLTIAALDGDHAPWMQGRALKSRLGVVRRLRQRTVRRRARRDELLPPLNPGCSA